MIRVRGHSTFLAKSKSCVTVSSFRLACSSNFVTSNPSVQLKHRQTRTMSENEKNVWHDQEEGGNLWSMSISSIFVRLFVQVKQHLLLQLVLSVGNVDRIVLTI